MKKYSLYAIVAMFGATALFSCSSESNEEETKPEGACPVSEEMQTKASEAAVSATATGADKSVFAWTRTVSGDATLPTGTEVQVNDNITADVTWTKDNVYILNGRITVLKGATLTIDAGTLIKGAEGQDAKASALMVAVGGKIMANGTAAEPIIMTSVADDGTKDETVRGLWGGLVILGDAKISPEEGETAQIEGVPANDTNGIYGGENDAHNAGVISYVSIRHGGIQIDEGSEINGLTLGGVGSETQISNVEVYANKDDGIEFFGGTVNVTNLLIAYQGDDGVDIDQAYAGTVTNFYVMHGGSTETDEGLEIDGPEGDVHSSGMFTLVNGTVESVNEKGSLADFKSKAQGTVNNVKFVGYASDASVKIRASFSDACTTDKTDAYTNLVNDSKLTFTGSEFSGVKVYTKSEY